MPGIVQGTEYTIMNKTGLFPVLLRLNLEKKNRPKKKKKVNIQLQTVVPAPREINIV